MPVILNLLGKVRTVIVPQAIDRTFWISGKRIGRRYCQANELGRLVTYAAGVAWSSRTQWLSTVPTGRTLRSPPLIPLIRLNSRQKQKAPTFPKGPLEMSGGVDVR